MIPFDVDPMGYYLCAVICCCIIVLVILAYGVSGMREACILLSCIYLILLPITFFVLIVDGSAYTDTITICAHTDGNTMKVIDTNQNLYYIDDDLTQMKVKDNDTVKVKVKERGGTKFIYSIDSPITCGNQACGATPT